MGVKAIWELCLFQIAPLSHFRGYKWGYLFFGQKETGAERVAPLRVSFCFFCDAHLYFFLLFSQALFYNTLKILNSDFLRTLRIGRHSRKIDFSFISPKHTFGWTYSREYSSKFSRFILRPTFKKVQNWRIMAFSRLKIFKISRFFIKTAGA